MTENSDKFIYDCNLTCKCKKPDFNDSLINNNGEMCIHCDICGGVPND